MSGKTATADKPFSPTKSQLSKIAAQTNASTHEYQETVAFLESQLQRADSKWRCYFRTLVVIEYLLHFGNERCVRWATENLDSIRALELFNHADGKAKFRGKKDHSLEVLRFPTSPVYIKKYSTICSKTGHTFAF
jgi:epsin